MKYLDLAKKTIRMFYRKLRAFARAPIVEVEISKVFDRLGKHILTHELLNILEFNNSEVAKECYRRYVESIIKSQKGHWLEKIIGKSKDVNYWITPWGGGEKNHGEKYLSSEYLSKYVTGALEIKDKIMKDGYLPKKFGYITGQLLINEKGEKSFIIWNGHRRSLTLAYLGYKKIKVEISGGDRWNGEIQNHIIKISELDDWKNVKNGLYTKEEATRFFYKFFN